MKLGKEFRQILYFVEKRNKPQLLANDSKIQFESDEARLKWQTLQMVQLLSEDPNVAWAEPNVERREVVRFGTGPRTVRLRGAGRRRPVDQIEVVVAGSEVVGCHRRAKPHRAHAPDLAHA